MNCLVTGGAGFIGSNLVDSLISDGHTVTVIDNQSSDAHENFYWNPAANNILADICDESTDKLYKNIDVVFHLAAEARIQSCIENPGQAFQTNIIGTYKVLDNSLKAGVKRLVFSSTSAAYGLSNNPPMSEEMPTDCLNPYSVSKVCAEEICKMYTKLYNFETVIFRYFNVYGERQPTKGQYAPVIGIFQRQQKNKTPLTIVGSGEQRRDFVYVGDVVRANIMAAEFDPRNFKNWKWGQVYNVGSGVNYSVNQIANMIGGTSINLPPRIGEAE